MFTVSINRSAHVSRTTFQLKTRFERNSVQSTQTFQGVPHATSDRCDGSTGFFGRGRGGEELLIDDSTFS